MITSAWRIGCQNNTGAASLATDTVSCIADITSVSSTGTLSVTPNVTLLSFTGSIASGAVQWGPTQPIASTSWVMEADCHITAMNNGTTPSGTMAFWIQFLENGVIPTGLGIPLGALAFTGIAGSQDTNALIRV